MSSEQTLEELTAFEARRRQAADAVTSDLPESLQGFVTFVWYVLACEEALSGVMDDTQLDSVVEALFAARQMNPDQLSRLTRFAHDVRATYASTDSERRRAWARSGTQIASATRLDALAAQLAQTAQTRADRGAAAGAIDVLDRSGTLQELLTLPDVPENAWRFHRSPKGADVEVDLADALKRWTSGQPLAAMAEDLLQQVPQASWRLEQIVDRVSRGFGHSISWMIATVLDRANALLAADGQEPICPALALYTRFGVDSAVALQLITRSLRSRGVAVAVAAAAVDAGVADDAVNAWLASVPIEQWAAGFGARPSDVLDLLGSGRAALRRPRSAGAA